MAETRPGEKSRSYGESNRIKDVRIYMNPSSLLASECGIRLVGPTFRSAPSVLRIGS
jgi:hypothetical protein